MKKSAFKTFTLLSAMMFALVLNSCESDEGNQFENNLYGTWTLDKMEVSNVEIGGVNVIQVLQTTFGYTLAEAEGVLDSIFSDLGEGFSEVSGTLSFNEDYTYVASLSDEGEEGEWSLSSDGKILSLLSEEPEELEIESLTASQLVILDDVEEAKADLDDDGMEETDVTFTVRFTFIK